MAYFKMSLPHSHSPKEETRELMVCGGHVGGITQNNMLLLLVPLLNPAGLDGCYCLSHPERLIANQEYQSYANDNL